MARPRQMRKPPKNAQPEAVVDAATGTTPPPSAPSSTAAGAKQPAVRKRSLFAGNIRQALK